MEVSAVLHSKIRFSRQAKPREPKPIIAIFIGMFYALKVVIQRTSIIEFIKSLTIRLLLTGILKLNE
jgi:hypothetical protein